ncbi:hypothetical protein [Natrialba sp. INN-245]|uniref:hypothetical protein n=1 Tax=Natrialba sp. INN-245 TaxID=2690967 RepID=UPI00131287B2|nr:hypothetical protein [Natrialba sp. INN-245]MWV38597.1 hypothetical protein [Natrialba sp. INN-245]
MFTQLIEELLFGVFLDRNERGGLRWAGLFLGMLCLLLSVVAALWIETIVGIALAVVGAALTVYCF